MAAKQSKDDKTTKTAPKMVERKKLPSVDYLLKHGDPDTAHLPKTWFQIAGYPFILALIFAASLLTFHHAPWDTLPVRKKYTLPSMKRLSMFDKRDQHNARVPHLNKKPAAKAEL
jgi:hypothetical protein